VTSAGWEPARADPHADLIADALLGTDCAPREGLVIADATRKAWGGEPVVSVDMHLPGCLRPRLRPWSAGLPGNFDCTKLGQILFRADVGNRSATLERRQAERSPFEDTLARAWFRGLPWEVRPWAPTDVRRRRPGKSAPTWRGRACGV
jgi:hypothetical protein